MIQKKCPFMSGIVSASKSEVGGLVFTSAQMGKSVFIECIQDDCMAWQELASSVPDFVTKSDLKYMKPDQIKVVGYCKLIDRKCH